MLTREPFCRVQGQTGQEFPAVQHKPKEGKWLPSGEILLKHSKAYPVTVSRTETSIAAGPSNKPVQEVTIPSSSRLLSLGLDTTLIKEFTHHPVGGCLSLFKKNWKKVTPDG